MFIKRELLYFIVFLTLCPITVHAYSWSGSLDFDDSNYEVGSSGTVQISIKNTGDKKIMVYNIGIKFDWNSEGTWYSTSLGSNSIELEPNEVTSPITVSFNVPSSTYAGMHQYTIGASIEEKGLLGWWDKGTSYLSSWSEIRVVTDSDYDGVYDYQDPCPINSDCDSDGISDKNDQYPTDSDHDNDGLIDGSDPNPNKADYDGDGILDGSDPCVESYDCDNDGLSDGSDPCPTTYDCDNDGLNDKEDPCPQSSDCDNDGLSDKVDPCPTISDCDSDGISDKSDKYPENPDYDNDKLLDGLDPDQEDPDFDKDGFIDGLDSDPEFPETTLSVYNAPLFTSNGKLNAWIITGNNAKSPDVGCASDVAKRLKSLSGVSKSIEYGESRISSTYKQDNLVLIGGPVANSLVAEINHYLPIKFTKSGSTWLLQGETNYEMEQNSDIGVLEIIQNPWNKNKKIIVAAGLTREGTKAAASFLSLSKNKDSLKGEALIVQRLGNGDVSIIEVLGTTEVRTAPYVTLPPTTTPVPTTTTAPSTTAPPQTTSTPFNPFAVDIGSDIDTESLPTSTVKSLVNEMGDYFDCFNSGTTIKFSVTDTNQYFRIITGSTYTVTESDSPSYDFHIVLKSSDVYELDSSNNPTNLFKQKYDNNVISVRTAGREASWGEKICLGL